MLRNKVVMNGGNLQQTDITWFYPISMSPKRVNLIRTTWNNAYHKYFGNGTTKSMTESSAPIQYFFRQNATATNLVSIDIGGGTTDIAFAKMENCRMLHLSSLLLMTYLKAHWMKAFIMELLTTSRKWWKIE